MIAAGAFFYARDTERFLFLHRTQGKHAHVWGLVGGSQESGETPWDCCAREIREEIGVVDIEKIIPLERFCSSNSQFEYHTYLCIVEQEFQPFLNHEHDGYAWVSYSAWPRPLHYGVKNTLGKQINQAKMFTLCSILKDELI